MRAGKGGGTRRCAAGVFASLFPRNPGAALSSGEVRFPEHFEKTERLRKGEERDSIDFSLSRGRKPWGCMNIEGPEVVPH